MVEGPAGMSAAAGGTSVPEEPGAEARGAVYCRAEAIWNWLRVPRRTGRYYTREEIAGALGLTHSGIGTALAVARGLARQHGEFITNCESYGRTWVLCHLYGDAEDGKSVAGLMVRNRSLTKQMANHAGQSDWVSRHAVDPLEREWAATNASIMTMAVTTADQMARLQEAIMEARRDRSSPGQVTRRSR